MHRKERNPDMPESAFPHESPNSVDSRILYGVVFSQQQKYHCREHLFLKGTPLALCLKLQPLHRDDCHMPVLQSLLS